MPVIEEDAYLAHYGILRKSGRYPWGSGGDEVTRSRAFLETVAELRRQGMSDTEIAKSFSSKEHPFTTTNLRAATTIAKNADKAAKIAQAQAYKDKGVSNIAIGERMGINESSVRALLAPGEKDKVDNLQSVAGMLKNAVDQKGYIDIGKGVENHLGISAGKLSVAAAMLKEQGYEVHNVQVDQLGTGNKTLIKVLAPPGTTYRDIVTNKDKITQVTNFSDDGGRTWNTIKPPKSIDLDRVQVAYSKKNAKDEEIGGGLADGVIYVRRGVDDISLGGASYAQVRVAVNGTHYLKGMAVYKDDMPPGVDLIFNTNKTDTGNKLDAMKPMKKLPGTDKIDMEDPFGSSIDHQIFKNPGDKTPSSVMNIVNKEGRWEEWSKNLASQMLSKQDRTLAKEQLAKTYEKKRQDLEEIMSLTNPAVKKKLLRAYADDVDASSVHLKAAAMDRQATQVILPVNSLKDTEVYAPNFRPGERVVLIRYPHGGTFEIPELTVNNRNPEAKSLLGNAKDAIGINAKVAERLSGADFDGDTVIVIPNNSGKVKTSPALEGLKNFDPKREYPAYEGMPRMTAEQKAREMGKASNLITDMTIKGANPNEIARAVRHSMVVIDAEKHNLNWKLSAERNGIAALKRKYQGGADKGASTLISRTTSDIRVNKRKPQYRINPETGEKIWVETGEGYIKRTTNKKGVVKEEWVPKTTKSTKGAETADAHTLSSGTAIEKVYADHSNRLKDLANQARKEFVATKPVERSPSAAKVYADEVARLNADLNIALRNAPLERQAQIIANAKVKAKRDANPDMDADELKKVKARALRDAREVTGADKLKIKIDDKQWEAIQAGALSNSRLSQILDHADLDQVRKLATPKDKPVLTSAKQAQAKRLLGSGATQAEVAAALGVSLTTLKTYLNEGS